MELSSEKLRTKYKKAADALITLKELHEDMADAKQIARCANQDPQKIYKIYRDSFIQRFEYTFDTTWKYIGDYLQAQGRTFEIKTPKEIFRQSLVANLLSETDTRLALQMVDHRNLTTHGYDEELIEKICTYIPRYIELLEQLLKRTEL
jgi:nucleotidyltransferase substrate binding protein (TIGR01987 family)